MTQEIATREQETALATTFSQETMDLWRRTYCRGASDTEFALFLRTCQRTGLDPEMRQIYMSSRTYKGETTRKAEVTVDGMRATAVKSGKYRGQLGPYWCGRDGVWKDIWIDKEPPFAAKVAVLHADFAEPLWAAARTDAYYVENNPIWRKAPDVMIAKCAEMLAIRKAFPMQTAGLYSDVEMEQADQPEQEPTKVKIVTNQPKPEQAVPPQRQVVNGTFRTVEPNSDLINEPVEDQHAIDRLECVQCARPLQETRFRDGTVWSPEQLAGYGRRKHNRVLCMPHYRDANDARKRAEQMQEPSYGDDAFGPEDLRSPVSSADIKNQLAREFESCTNVLELNDVLKKVRANQGTLAPADYEFLQELHQHAQATLAVH